MYILKDEERIHGVFSTESYAILASRFVHAEHGSDPCPELNIVWVQEDKMRGVDIRTLLRFYEDRLVVK
jgi:hypothetical protein